MSTDLWSRNGRTLFIQFECYRCGKTQFEEYSTLRSLDENDYINTFYDFSTPKGWGYVYSRNFIMCPECTEALDEFIKEGRKTT